MELIATEFNSIFVKVIPFLLMNFLKPYQLSEYRNDFPSIAQKQYERLVDAEISTETFSFYTSVASVFSSKIEGENIDLDSYIKYKKFGISFQPDYTKKIDDLYNAYSFAMNHPLNEQNIATAHVLLSKNLVYEPHQGKYRNQIMYITTGLGKIEYVAATPNLVKSEMKLLFEDIEELLKTDLSFEESFYYASLIHLVFAKIHPWMDGNGRSTRLLEKWFLASKLDKKAWFIQSERRYYEQLSHYYDHLKNVGFEYENLDYEKSLPFTKMLVRSLI